MVDEHSDRSGTQWRAPQGVHLQRVVFRTFYLVLREPVYFFGSSAVRFFDRWGAGAPGDSVREGL